MIFLNFQLATQTHLSSQKIASMLSLMKTLLMLVLYAFYLFKLNGQKYKASTATQYIRKVLGKVHAPNPATC